MPLIRSLSILILLTGVASGVQAAKFYKWTDENGQVHYGQRAPAGVESEQVRTYGDRAPSSPAPSSQPAPQPTTVAGTTESKAPAAPKAQKDPETCRKAQENARIMSTKPLVLDPDGNIMTIEQKNKELEKAQAIINIHCEQ